MTLEKFSEIVVHSGISGHFFVYRTSDKQVKLVPVEVLCARPLIRPMEVVEWAISPGSAASVRIGLVYKEVAYAKRDRNYTFSFKKVIPSRVQTVTLPIRIVVH